ncbi:Cys-tRNA(Pro) deacylase [Novosphingobium sediminicola]|uniref:Cys-tRNA(Pro)/Cys-tRNA(Cys) deacylase n=1 Tax=Novosphingobium sediminicola TaxID=563162 RepID=A0A7W6CB40_9SPHN|nr:Cys-tRNA(Pro) deacylase [Novosphingobium sediminicola]MBB3953313.1 Cys-tRNA(Pro)/Cys-tRNA(Cys) deacylase [Novosphingobium sediminicola]
MAKATRATQFLDRAGVTFTLHTYDYDPDADSIGQAAAAALSEPAGRVFKTLMVLADGKPACVIAPSDREVAMKKAAAALGVKQAVMMKPADAERITGYKIGGISPFGQTRKVPVVLDASAQEWESIYINGGQRGLQVRLAPDDAISALGARQAEIAV